MSVKSLGSLVVVSLVSMLVIGCAKAPDQELGVAKATLDSARVAEADKYVAADYTAASDSINAAIVEIEKQKTGSFATRNYDKAKALLASATAAAQRARSQAQAAKQKAQAEADTSLFNEKAAIAEARGLLAKAPKGKEGKTVLEAIGNEISAVETSMTEAEKVRSDGNFAEALDKSKAGIAKLDGIKAELTAATEKVSGRKAKR